jgi:hypothetical protein
MLCSPYAFTQWQVLTDKSFNLFTRSVTSACDSDETKVEMCGEADDPGVLRVG